MVKLQSGENLTPEETIRAEHLSLRLMNNWLVAEASFQNGLLDKEMYGDIIENARRTFAAYPSIKAIIRRLLGHYPATRQQTLMQAAFDDY
jgi:hypothetical protein